MEKSNKMYTKALRLYENGYLDRALEMSEKAISCNLKNSAALNLKGLLLYFKGDLQGARAMWSISKEVNKDDVSKRYLLSTAADSEKEDLYKEALELAKEIKLREAVVLLRECEKSDFNIINVCNALTSCLIKLGSYDAAESCINKVLSLHRNNREAKENLGLMIEYGIKPRRGNRLKLAVAASILFMVATAAILWPYAFGATKNIHSNNTSKISFRSLYSDVFNKGKLENSTLEAGEDDLLVPAENKNLSDNVEKEEDFPRELLAQLIEVRDYDEVYSYLESWKDKKLSVEEALIYVEAVRLMEGRGALYFYNSSRRYFAEKSYERAEQELFKAYNYSAKHYIHPHVIFMLASVNDRMGKNEEAAAFYTIYSEEYEEGDYIETVYYKLALLYRDTNISKAQKFAEKLISNYPKSIYNNTIVEEIMNE
jgi:tetratricopeptide (TPR) repeat protein